MTDSNNGSREERDPFRLIRDGTSQHQRQAPALDPASAPVDEHSLAHRLVFAREYSGFLRYIDHNDLPAGDWREFFTSDSAALIAVAAVQEVDFYRQQVREYAAFLNDRANRNRTAELRNRLDCLFSCCATLALGLDALWRNLTRDLALSSLIDNLVHSRLAPALVRLVAFYRGGQTLAGVINGPADERVAFEVVDGRQTPLQLFGMTAVKFSSLGVADLSSNWSDHGDWAAFYGAIDPDISVFGGGTTIFERINHLATHNLFTSVLDQFLKGYARVVDEAGRTLHQHLAGWDGHQPHYALFLAFLRLFEHARVKTNTLTASHLDFYYRQILGLKEKAAVPARAHLLVELARQADSCRLGAGELFKAGKDGLGNEVLFASDRDFVANRAKVASLMSLYRHGAEPVSGNSSPVIDRQRFFASPVAASGDGLGGAFPSADQSWHPFFNTIYHDGRLAEIRMAKAEIGFAVASHYLFLAGGRRTITLSFSRVAGRRGKKRPRQKKPVAFFAQAIEPEDLSCLLTGAQGWLTVEDVAIDLDGGELQLVLSGAEPPIVGYVKKTHGYGFATDLPMLMVVLNHRDDAEYRYRRLADLILGQIVIDVRVEGLTALSVANDLGPLDTSKGFQPFGPLPVNGAAVTIGAREAFQKNLVDAAIVVQWQNTPAPYSSLVGGEQVPPPPAVGVSFLAGGSWGAPGGSYALATTRFELGQAANVTVVDAADFSANMAYDRSCRHGYLRLVFTGDFGLGQYQIDLTEYILEPPPKKLAHPGQPRAGPVANALTMDYQAEQWLNLTRGRENDFAPQGGHFYHVTPFGQAEQHAGLATGEPIHLLPQFEFFRDALVEQSEAEFYIGITGLTPPCNLSLLFQVADGTADPLTTKPHPHIHWSYLQHNRWVAFAGSEIEDDTGELVRSGIITFTVPREISADNTLLPSGSHWLRAAVAGSSEAVCRLLMVAPQALSVTFVDRDNDPAFTGQPLPAKTIDRLYRPVAAIKQVTQPFASFGGRGREVPAAFSTRVSERLRHKDRGVSLWDYERLILEAFPQIFKVKCLPHTQYEPGEGGAGIYRELAPGHVTVVTIPNLANQNLRDPLRPFTSLGLLDEIARFLSGRLSCFVTLHVRNPEFEEVRFGCRVRLYQGFDETYHLNLLAEEVSRYLSPWAFGGGDGPLFAGRISKAALVNFVEDLPYVDYLTDVRLFHTSIDSRGETQVVEREEVVGSKAISILIAARTHAIEPLPTAGSGTSAGTGGAEHEQGIRNHTGSARDRSVW